MKLADAMRMADVMRIPNRRGMYIARNVKSWRGEIPPTCAIGAAALVARKVSVSPSGMRLTQGEVDAFEQAAQEAFAWPTTWASCPMCPWGRYLTRGIVEHLYDGHRRSRTQIAKWLDSLERKP